MISNYLFPPFLCSPSVSRGFEIVNQYSWFWKSLQIANREGQLSFYWDIYIKNDVKYVISTYSRRMIYLYGNMWIAISDITSLQFRVFLWKFDSLQVWCYLISSIVNSVYKLLNDLRINKIFKLVGDLGYIPVSPPKSKLRHTSAPILLSFAS